MYSYENITDPTSKKNLKLNSKEGIEILKMYENALDNNKYSGINLSPKDKSVDDTIVSISENQKKTSKKDIILAKEDINDAIKFLETMPTQTKNNGPNTDIISAKVSITDTKESLSESINSTPSLDKGPQNIIEDRIVVLEESVNTIKDILKTYAKSIKF